MALAVPPYRLSGTEVRLRAEKAVLESQLALMVADSSGGALIGAMQEEAARLKAREGIHIKTANGLIDSQAQVRRLEADGKEDRAEIRRLNADLAYSYSINRAQAQALEDAERRVAEEQAISHALGVRLLEMAEENKRLITQLGRDSGNSSLPPSATPNKKKIYSSREKTDRNPGAQPGHAHHPRRRHAPDHVIELLAPDTCLECGGTITKTGECKTRQLVDIEVTVYATDYISPEHICECCKATYFPGFPEGIDDDVNYSSNVRAIPVFLTSCCNVSIDNVRRFLYEATSHKLDVSKGFVHNSLARFSEMAKPAIEGIGSSMAKSQVMHSDATFIRSDGREAYIYVYLDQDGVVFQASDTKGRRPLEESILKGYQGIIVHDHDISYYHYGAGHGQCAAHILRYLKGICENEPGRLWAEAMHALLVCANKEAIAARKANLVCLPQEVIDGFYERYDKIIALAKEEYERDGPFNPKYKPEGIRLFTRLDKYEDDHLRFLKNLTVPFTNNFAEQALRTSKKKMRQTGGFRSTERGVAYYCDVLTVTQTAAMREMEMLKAIQDIFDGNTDIFKTDIVKVLSGSP